MAQSSQASGSQHKKRKGGAVEAPTGVKVVVAESSSSAGPVWANFPSTRPSAQTPFHMYNQPRAPTANSDVTRQQTLLAGETGDVEFFSVNRDLAEQVEGESVQYLPALYDPSTSTLHLHPSTPHYLLSLRPKSHRALPTFSTSASYAPISSYESVKKQRTALGQAFGTRKAIGRIKTEERNRVDAGAMEGSREALMGMIGEAAKSMPSVESLAAEEFSNRLIPPPNTTTTDPSLVYPLHVLIPPEQLAAIDHKSIIKAVDEKARIAMFPLRRSEYIRTKVRVAMGAALGPKVEHIQILYYLSALRLFLQMKTKLGKPMEELSPLMHEVPMVIIKGMIERFTESSKGSTRGPQVSPPMETKIRAYEFALMLRLENYACEIGPISADMEIEERKCREIFKSLGCTVDALSKEDRARLNMTVADAKAAKRAILQAPPVFPAPKRGPPKRK